VMESRRLFFKRDVGLGFHLLGGEFCLARISDNATGEAGGVRCADQFFPIRSPVALKRLAKP